MSSQMVPETSTQGLQGPSNVPQSGDLLHPDTSSMNEHKEQLAKFNIAGKDRDVGPPAPNDVVPNDEPHVDTPHSSFPKSRMPSLVQFESRSPMSTPPESPEKPRYYIPRYESASSNYSTHDEADVIAVRREGNSGNARLVSPVLERDQGAAASKPAIKKLTFPKLKRLILHAADEAMSGGRRVYLEIHDDHWQIEAFAEGSRRNSAKDESRLPVSKPQESDPSEIFKTLYHQYGRKPSSPTPDDEDKEELKSSEQTRIKDLRAAQNSLKSSLSATLNNDKLLNLLSSELGKELKSTTFNGDADLERDIKVFVTTLQNGEAMRKKVERDMRRVDELTREIGEEDVMGMPRSGLGAFHGNVPGLFHLSAKNEPFPVHGKYWVKA